MNNVEFLVVKEKSSFRTIWDTILITVTAMITFTVTLIIIIFAIVLFSYWRFESNLNPEQKKLISIIKAIQSIFGE